MFGRLRNRIRAAIWRLWMRPVIYPLFYRSHRVPFWVETGADRYKRMGRGT